MLRRRFCLFAERSTQASVQPETVADAIAHYSKHELTPERKAFATIDSHSSYLKLHVRPRWGGFRLSEVRTIAVEEWLAQLQLAPGSRAKIRNIMSALFSHAIRYEWITFNPITKVRTSAVRLREPDVLTPDEFSGRFLPKLPLRERTMVMLAGSTGLRRSEMFALRWSDLCLVTMQVSVTRAVVRNRFGDVKTPASRKPVPLHVSVCRMLAEWRSKSLYRDDSDFLFPSIRLNGAAPLMPDMVLKKTIRPRARGGGHSGQGNRLAFISALTCNQPSVAWGGREGSSRASFATQTAASQWTFTPELSRRRSASLAESNWRCCLDARALQTQLHRFALERHS